MVYCTLKYESNILIKKKLAAIYLYLHKKVWTNPLSGYVYIIHIYQWMSVQFFYTFLAKKFWLQFICSKLISTTAHESVEIISTKWFMHISHLISVNIFLEKFDTFLFVWSFSAQTLDATGKLYHLRLRVECTLFCNLQSWAWTHAVLVIGLYELLDPTT